MTNEIRHDKQRKRFICEIEGNECFVDYETDPTESRTLTIFKTFVHPDLRGKGIAESLLKRISEYAMENKFTIIPQCSYAVLYYRRHSEHACVLTKDVNLEEDGGSCRLK